MKLVQRDTMNANLTISETMILRFIPHQLNSRLVGLLDSRLAAGRSRYSTIPPSTKTVEGSA